MADPQARIFISYRREDSGGHVLALLPALRRHFGDRVFKDTDNIPPGDDFVKFINRELDSCSVLLAVIGRDWLTVQDPRLKTRRLDNPDDFLRIEVSTALRSERIRVIPVLVERGTMPSAADLPPDLAALAHRNALELSDARWESDVQLLIQAIQRAFAATAAPTEAPPQRPGLQHLEKRRVREMTAHLAAAQEAFDARDYEAALLSCEKVLLLDPKATEALELLDRAGKALDELKIETWLKEAGQSLRQGDAGGASDLIDQALSIDPASETALSLRKEMLAVRRERERDRERARAVVAATQLARTSLDEEDFDDAVRHADDALALEPQSTDAHDLRLRAIAARDERRRRRESRRRAQPPVTHAREERRAGAQQEALVPPGSEEERRTPEPHAVPELPAIRRYGAVAAAAALILSAAIGLWQYQQRAAPTGDGGPTRSEPTSTPETKQTSSVPGPSGTTDPSATVGASARGRSPDPVQPPATEPKDKGTLRANRAAPISPNPPDPEPSRPSSGQSISAFLGAEIARQRVADVVQRYVKGYNDLNAAAVKEVYPSLSEEDVQWFSQAKSYNLNLEDVTIEISADAMSATVSAIPRVEGLRGLGTMIRTFTLRKQGDSWIIVSITNREFRV